MNRVQSESYWYDSENEKINKIYEKGFDKGLRLALDRVLEIIDEVSPTERRTFDVQEIRDRVLALKGW